MLHTHQQLEMEISKISNTLASLPDGKLLLCSDGRGHQKWFRSDGHKKVYLKKSQKNLAQELAYKKYLSFQLEEFLHEKRAIEFYLRHHQEKLSKKDQLFSESQEFQTLIAPYFVPLNQELQTWMTESYPKNPSHPQHLIYKTNSGEYVRSKSEAFIFTTLYNNRIPFRYECELSLDSVTFYPDFTIRHPKTGDFFYWEHFGMMDNSSYASNAFHKMDLYNAHGITPSVNLITTFESKNSPLDLELVQKTIDYYFL